MKIHSPAARRSPIALAAAVSLGAVAAVCHAQSAPSDPRDWAVVSGQARFEVLSPRVIRTEFAGDKKFQNGATFNAVGRDKFSKPKFTTERADGWLTISTSAMRLKYREGAGAFDARNLIVQLVGDGPISAVPWQHLECDLGRLCEAEALSASGPAVASDHTGYTGDGFLAGFATVNDALTIDVHVPAAGTYSFQARFANGVGGDGQHAQRSLSLVSRDGSAQSLLLPTTANWDTWSVAGSPIQLNAGKNTLLLVRSPGDSGNVNIDSVALVNVGAGFPPLSSRQALDCAYGTVCEAENARLAGSATLMKDHTGFAGSGFVAEINQGSSIAANVIGVPADGVYSLQLRYANSAGGDGLNQTRLMQVSVAGASTTLSLPVTGSWDTWQTAQLDIHLKAGDNLLTLGCPDTTSCHVNVDTLALAAQGASALTPHFPLGGYRRSLDGIHGGIPPLTPGLLYRDGWALLDDTQTALYDSDTDTLKARPSHGGETYQDGYVFAYGGNYKKALGDLAKLTGPALLLPRWAYGVWFSEYYDRTAADFQNNIVPRFRSEGVPLDVLVVDTDFKAVDTWSGWEIDTAKFPDPKGFLDWVHGQGLFAPFNIHPSIVGNDPQFAQAQATAKNKLTRTYCGGTAGSSPFGCYGFDWADPDQLAAYFNLHQQMEDQGVDVWWLDWCCDGSRASRRDVASDAYINQKYATRMSKKLGRGFAFSRAYGSGPANNLPHEPMGPWADKRSTLHFTGDTYSTWEMLASAGGYTAAESAATGMSSVSHDIGGHNNPGDQAPGAEPGTTRMADDMYARWVQLGTFQPILRLHSNHGDRLPWQYGPAGQASATKFLRLREQLVPTTYSLAHAATKTGVPLVRAMYLEYPKDDAAYAAAWSQYLYGPDILVAPAATPGNPTSTSVWFPPGAWTDYFSGLTYAGNATRSVTTDLNAMPVFLKAGGMLVTRSDNAPNDVQNPMKSLTVTLATGAKGRFTLFEDDGRNPKLSQSASTAMAYDEAGADHSLVIKPADGSFAGQVTQRSWTVVFMNASAPGSVTLDGVAVPPGDWSHDQASRRLTVKVPQRSVLKATTVAYR